MVEAFLTNWLFWSLPAAGFGFVLLLHFIILLVQTAFRAPLSSVPLASGVAIEFNEGGKFQMHVASPRFTTTFYDLRFQLVDRANNQPLQIAKHLVPLVRSGVSDVTRSYGTVEIPKPGSYVLQVSGIDEARDYTQYRVFFSRPYAAHAILYILGILLSAGVFVFGTIMSLVYLNS